MILKVKLDETRNPFVQETSNPLNIAKSIDLSVFDKDGNNVKAGINYPYDLMSS